MLKKQTQFYFVRHGQTDYNHAGIVMGCLDIPLNEAGRVQAHQAAQLLRGHHFKSIASGPLVRAHETALIIGAYFGINPFVIDDLREACWGVIEGTTKRWTPGITLEEAEPYVDFQSRVAVAVNEALESEGPVVVVSHGGVARALCELLHVDSPAFHNAIPYRFYWEGDAWKVQELIPG
jgi:broad specificity phosphatase PhoE